MVLQTSPVPMQTAGLANMKSYSPGASSLTGAGAMRAAGLGTVQLFGTMQGQRVLTEHYFVVGAILPSMFIGVVDAFGYILRDKAKEIHLPHYKTGDTYRSIMATGATSFGNAYYTQVSVSTPYAKFLEFGFVHYQTGKWIWNPFMIPAADAITPAFYDAIMQCIGIASDRRFLTGLAATTPAADVLASARQALYSYSKFAGDLQVLGFGGLSASRGYAIKGAKGIGNLQAARAGTLGARATRLVAGRFGGAQIRSGSFSSGMSGVGGRVYNRLSGRAFGGALSGIG